MAITSIQTRNIKVEVKQKAEKYAQSLGFTSLNDVIRIFVHDLANKKIKLGFDWGSDRYQVPYASPQEHRQIQSEISQLTQEDKQTDNTSWFEI